MTGSQARTKRGSLVIFFSQKEPKVKEIIYYQLLMASINGKAFQCEFQNGGKKQHAETQY